MNYSVNKPATVSRLSGAALYYVRGDQVYRQDVDEQGDLINDDEEHIDWGKGDEGKAMNIANAWQKKANSIIQKQNQKR